MLAVLLCDTWTPRKNELEFQGLCKSQSNVVSYAQHEVTCDISVKHAVGGDMCSSYIANKCITHTLVCTHVAPQCAW